MTSQTLSPSLASLIQKYNLDISIVEVTNIKESRLDSDFYSISRKDFDETRDFKDLVDFTDFIKKWIFDISPSNYVQQWWVPFIRSWDLKDSFVGWGWIIQINTSSHLQEIKTELEKGDMLISKVWTIWDVALNLDYEKLNFSQNVIWIKIKQEYKNLSGYLMAFLNSKAGREQIERKISWQVQFKITLEDIRTLKIPLPSTTFQSSIASLVQEAHKQRELSKSLYAEAEQILLRELDLIGWQPSDENITEKMSSEVELFGRCAAEFFQPKYDEILEKIQSWKTKKLDSLFDVFGWKSYKYTWSKDQIMVIKTKNLRLDEIALEWVEDFISTEERDKTKIQFVQKRDVLFASMGVGSLWRSNIFLRTCLISFAHSPRIDILRSNIL